MIDTDERSLVDLGLADADIVLAKLERVNPIVDLLNLLWLQIDPALFCELARAGLRGGLVAADVAPRQGVVAAVGVFDDQQLTAIPQSHQRAARVRTPNQPEAAQEAMRHLERE